MNTASFDAIVLGLGIMGSASAFELQRRGLHVLGLEQFQPRHPWGSSHGSIRVIRKAYFEHPSYVPLLHRAYDGFYDLEQRSGLSLLSLSGVLSLGRPTSELIQGVHRSAQEHRLNLESLDAAELKRRFPQFSLPEDIVGAFETSGGFVQAETSVSAYCEQAKALGAQLNFEEPVLSWKALSNGVEVVTPKNRYQASKLIIAGGAWAASLLASLQLPALPRRVVQLWFQPQNPALFRRDRFPVYIADMPEAVFYGFPAVDPRGHKCALHQPGEAVDNPSLLQRPVFPTDEAAVRPLLERYLPGAAGKLSHAQPCMYTMTPDQHFVLDLHPEHRQVAIAAGFSGHGFKFAPVVGEIMADLAESGQTDLPVEMFRIGRFHK